MLTEMLGGLGLLRIGFTNCISDSIILTGPPSCNLGENVLKGSDD